MRMKMIKLLRIFRTSLLLLAIASITGCATDNKPNQGTAAAVQGILTDITKSVNDIKTAQTGLNTAQDNLKKQQDANGQFISDRIDESRYANKNNPQPNGATGLVESNLATTLPLLPAPSAVVKDKEIQDLKLALSTSATDKAQLQTQIESYKSQVSQLVGQTTLLTQQVATARTSELTATETATANVTLLSNETAKVKIEAASADVARKQQQEALAQKARVETARWFMLAGGVLIAIAIGLTFIHVPDALAVGLSVGGALLGIGWLITYIEDLLQQAWFRYVLDGAILSGLAALAWIGYRAYQHRQTVAATNTGFNNLVGAIQEASNKNPALAAEMQPILNEWHLDSTTGQTDPKVVTLINQTAAKLNLINPGQVSAASGELQPKPAVVLPVTSGSVGVVTPAPVSGSAPVSHVVATPTPTPSASHTVTVTSTIVVTGSFDAHTTSSAEVSPKASGSIEIHTPTQPPVSHTIPT